MPGYRKPKEKMPNPTLTFGFKATMKITCHCIRFFQFEKMMNLRQNLRKMRRTLSSNRQYTAALALFSHFLQLPFLAHMQHIAAYLAFEGEIDPVFIRQWCFEENRALYLPHIAQNKNNKKLTFIESRKDDTLKLNRLRILEPILTKNTQTIDVEQLNLILLPLVAFDRTGHRLGMGKGFYDTTLKGVKQPILIGLGHHFQEVDKIIPHENDVRLNGIITDKELILTGA